MPKFVGVAHDVDRDDRAILDVVRVVLGWVDDRFGEPRPDVRLAPATGGFHGIEAEPRHHPPQKGEGGLAAQVTRWTGDP